MKVSLDEVAPDVWRRLVLPVHWNLEHLHLGIQAAFNWWNYHLYEFRIGGL
ncbi:IS1096 element passenger TnpR family protein, partial [Neorhizobium galegae]|uniref:IS1096 element passenger TnpR family protein n=1 Tax=Neorhizobium galegae TaxID=399 RepID=UPI003F9DF4DB